MNINIVIGTGFGDEGKGVMVDNLCGHSYSLVVRFSGGQQCGHTVMRDGKKHVFSNFGAGTLRGASTYFTEHTTIFPRTFLREYEVLGDIGVTPPKTIIHPLARVTTIFDVAYNRASENFLTRNGSCGLGVGATMKRNDDTCYNLYACDLLNYPMYEQKLGAISRYYEVLIRDKSPNFIEDYYNQIESLKVDHRVEIESYLDKVRIDDLWNYSQLGYRFDDIVFEGSQGIQLDMHHGIFPNVTYANTTSKNAIEYLKKWNVSASIYYMSRCYGTRHGAGWIPNDDRVDLINNEEEINVENQYQQNFKTFEFDQKMVEQSVLIDSIYSAPYVKDTNLVLTCIDQRPKWKIPKFNTRFDQIYLNTSPKCDNVSAYYG